MPIIKSAIKKLKQDKKREKQNNELRTVLKVAIRKAKKTKSGKAVSIAIASADKAVKKNLIHKNKAARIKSTLSKLAKPEAKTKTPTVSKAASKKTVTRKKAAK